MCPFIHSNNFILIRYQTHQMVYLLGMIRIYLAASCIFHSINSQMFYCAKFDHKKPRLTNSFLVRWTYNWPLLNWMFLLSMHLRNITQFLRPLHKGIILPKGIDYMISSISSPLRHFLWESNLFLRFFAQYLRELSPGSKQNHERCRLSAKMRCFWPETCNIFA